MKLKLATTLLGGILAISSLSQAATVAFWDFENSTETSTTPTDGQAFCQAGSGAHGTADSISNVVMRGWSSTAGPLFTTDNLYYNGVAAEFTSSQRDGYINDEGLKAWQPAQWTIEYSVKHHALGGWQDHISRRGSSHGEVESDLYLQKENDSSHAEEHFRLNFRTVAGEKVVIDATNVVVQADQWYAIAAVSDGTTAYLYVNDGSGYELQGTYTYTNSVVAENTLTASNYDWIFGVGWNNGNLVDVFNGSMDNVRFSDEALSPAQFLELPADPFVITVSPTSISSETERTLKAVIVDQGSEFSSAELFLDGTSVANNTTPSGTTNTVSYTATMDYGVHTGLVVVAGSNPSATVSNTWTFESIEIKPVSLVHHWNFNETNGTVVADSVGGQDGTVIGTNHAWTGSALDLFGSGSSSDWNDGTDGTQGSYVDLPNGIVSALSNAATFEAVYTLDNLDSWPRVWAFGNSSAEGTSDTAAANIFLTARNGNGNIRMEISSASPGYSYVVVNISDTASVSSNQLYHVVVTYDSDALKTLLYVNGSLVASESFTDQYHLSSINDVNNWFGRSQYANDPLFNGKIDDMRIYNGIMTTTQVEERYAFIQAGGEFTPPEITNIAVDGETVTLSWTAGDFGKYSIERKNNLPFDDWSSVMTNLPHGNQTTNFTSNGQDQEFYRVTGEESL